MAVALLPLSQHRCVVETNTKMPAYDIGGKIVIQLPIEIIINQLT